MTSILIPAADIKKDSWNYLSLLLKSIQDGRIKDQFETVICFDGCSEEFIDKVYDSYSFVRFDKRFINEGRPLNFSGNVNRGLRILHGEERKDVIVVNQDCILPSVEHFQHLVHGDIASATEVCLAQECSKSEGLYEILLDTQPQEVSYNQVEKIIGFCYYMSVDFMDRVGYLNEYLQASFDDDDLCAKANLLDIPVWTCSTAVQHFQNKLGAYSSTDLPIRKNQFNILWHIPLEIPHEKFQQFIKDNHVWKEEYKSV